MHVSSINIHNYRSISTLPESLPLDQINILVGANNAGKSTILKALLMLQSSDNLSQDIRIGSERSTITMDVRDIPSGHKWNNNALVSDAFVTRLLIRNDGNTHLSFFSNGQNYNHQPISPEEPHHFIVPYFSKRKTVAYNQDVRLQHAMAITDNLQFLAAKLSRISNPDYPTHDLYRKTCIDVLGFPVTSIPSEAGQRPGIYLPTGETLPIEQMGEGVPNIVSLLVSLADSKGKLFLIEELENDLHPKALKAILDLIIESSRFNQFVISTHSNIVVRHLASADNSKLYNVKTVPGVLPTQATVELVPSTVEARLEVLRDLGYSFSDFDLWDGWLILEESSAEIIIRDYIIPWFAPSLSRIRTLSTKGADQVVATFEDLNRLVRFTHLEAAYRNRAWVRVDGDAKGLAIVERLLGSYQTWDADRFATYNEPQFENYYPQAFADRVTTVLNIQDRQAKREAKKQLLLEVRAWLDEDENRGKAALRVSAAEIITDLENISVQVMGL